MSAAAVVTVVTALVIAAALAYYLTRVVIVLRAVNDSLGQIVGGGAFHSPTDRAGRRTADPGQDRPRGPWPTRSKRVAASLAPESKAS